MTALDYFLIGMASGAALFFLVWLLADASYRDYLVRKAEPQYRTPVHINGKFFYVVPEREFVAIKMQALGRRGYPADEDEGRPA